MNKFTLEIPSIGYKKDLTLNVKCKAKMYFVAGAGNDTIGWDYTNRFNRIWTSLGISGFEKVNVPSGTNYGESIPPANDMIYALQYREEPDEKNPSEGKLAIPESYKPAHRRVREKINSDLKLLDLDEYQINLAGYSYGSVVMCQTAIQLAQEGTIVDNLILIGSPVNKNSNLYKALLKNQKEGKICQIIRHDIPGDYFSNTEGLSDIIDGIVQNAPQSGEHYDLARPDDPETPINETIEVDCEITELGNLLISKGIL